MNKIRNIYIFVYKYIQDEENINKAKGKMSKLENYQIKLLLAEPLKQAINYFSSTSDLTDVSYILKILTEHHKDYIIQKYGRLTYEALIRRYSRTSPENERRKAIEKLLKGYRGINREVFRRILMFVEENSEIENIDILIKIFEDSRKKESNYRSSWGLFGGRGFKGEFKDGFFSNFEMKDKLKALIQKINEKQPNSASFIESYPYDTLIINPQGDQKNDNYTFQKIQN